MIQMTRLLSYLYSTIEDSKDKQRSNGHKLPLPGFVFDDSQAYSVNDCQPLASTQPIHIPPRVHMVSLKVVF